MDMCHWCYQIELQKEDRPKPSFVTSDFRCQYRRLRFGFAWIPASLQRLVDMLLGGGMKWLFAIKHIDDIIVYSYTWADHFTHLRRLLEALRKANLEVHPGKRAFGAQEVKYLGHVVTRDGIPAGPSKAKAIVAMPRLASAKELHRCIGKCQCCRKFSANISEIPAALFKA